MITTALIPGRPAPKLIPAAAVRGMRPGSVIVDLAAEAGGNCELTVPGEESSEVDGVTIVGLLNLPSTMPTARQPALRAQRARRCSSTSPRTASSQLDLDDEITAGACVTNEKVAA